ncbi:uncharacterized protein LOC117593725 isoform X2 [Esox lucius]|uniref:uncharacterized protein LOC117593725 isoform X2 n=1 Tax=Esox lucius TaxID=8010 RepID=UPI001476BC31|nr:uncharacterized protein LOC117593725 isoform X2 [Esox lucius]
MPNQIKLLILLCSTKAVFSITENGPCELGGEVVLTPVSVTNPPSSILWRLGQNKVADFDMDFGTTVSYYGDFNGRTTLDKTTGELIITGLRKTDEGVYSVEFNSKRLEKTYTLSVLKPVPKPAIIVSCNDNKISCTLTCDGDTAGAEPVTYWWKEGERNLEEIGKLLTVSKSDSKLNQNRYKYTCKLKNGVSEKDSDPVGPLFDPNNVPCELGGEVVLTPVSMTNPPSSILWRLGQNMVADFDTDFGPEVTYYGDFNGRTTLDTTTGELTITGLRKTDEGVYSVEFNSKRLEKTYTLSVLKPVPKQAIIVSCNDNNISCTLTCDGDTAGAEPVTYWWKVGEGNWEEIGKLLTVAKSDSKLNQNGYKYTCKLKNGVSEKDSDPVGPLFDPNNVPCELGGEVVLTPVSMTNPPSSILWRLGQIKVADFDTDFGPEVTYYGDFNGRTTLDTTTGELTITGLRKTDEGVYSVEFNSKRLEKTYTLSVLKQVPKPAIIVSCNDNNISCNLTCDGDTAGAEPVTYWWKEGEGNWEEIGKLLTVIKSDSKLNQNGYKYTCKLKNPFSEEVSYSVKDVFGPGETLLTTKAKD